MKTVLSPLSTLIVSFILSVTTFVPAKAAESNWFSTDGARVRLIGLPSADGKTIDAGLQIELEKGWKTYWKSPGDSGLPPQISFIGSTNIAATKLKFPVPKMFGDLGGLSAGYDKSITLPLTIEPLFPNRSVNVKAQGIIGICAEICVPVQFSLTMNVGPSGQTKLDIARQLLASKTNLPQKPETGFRIKSVQFQAPKTLLVDAFVPKNTDKAELFIDAPAGWYLGPANLQERNGEEAKFKVELAHIPKETDPMTTPLSITLSADGAGVEQTITPK